MACDYDKWVAFKERLRSASALPAADPEEWQPPIFDVIEVRRQAEVMVFDLIFATRLGAVGWTNSPQGRIVLFLQWGRDEYGPLAKLYRRANEPFGPSRLSEGGQITFFRLWEPEEGFQINVLAWALRVGNHPANLIGAAKTAGRQIGFKPGKTRHGLNCPEWLRNCLLEP